MTKVPSLSYRKVINALQRAGFVVVRQTGSHIRLQKRLEDKIIKITVPAHIPIKKSTLSHIIKNSGLLRQNQYDLWYYSVNREEILLLTKHFY